MTTSRTCPQCNAEVGADDRFCSNCGFRLSEGEVGGLESPGSTEAQAPRERTAPAPAPPPRSTSDERTWVTFVHLAAFAGAFIPFGNIIGPLVIWLIKRPESGLVDFHGREALNFQISATIYLIACVILFVVLIGIFLLLALAVFWLVMVIMAAVRASNGQDPGYVLSIRFLK